MSFKSMKKNREQAAQKLAQQLDSVNSGSKNPDAGKYWTPTLDSNKNGSAIIRFLAGNAEVDNDPSFIDYYEHGFKGPTGQWYIEKSRTTLPNEADPVTELNNKLWNSGNEEDKEIVSKYQKRKRTFVANILVVKDPGNPANEGKVFMFRFGKKIFDKITKMSKPEYEGDEVVNPFDLWEGANFRLRIKSVAGFNNYDDSEFDKRTTAIAENDDEIEAIWNQRHNLWELIDPATFKSYDELKARLDLVLGNGPATPKSSSKRNLDFDDEPEDKVSEEPKSKFNLEKSLKEDDEPEIPSKKANVPASDDDEDLDYFQNLVKK